MIDPWNGIARLTDVGSLDTERSLSDEVDSDAPDDADANPVFPIETETVLGGGTSDTDAPLQEDGDGEPREGGLQLRGLTGAITAAISMQVIDQSTSTAIGATIRDAVTDDDRTALPPTPLTDAAPQKADADDAHEITVDMVHGNGTAEYVPTDPGFSSQEHLRNLTAGQFDLNLVDVWDDYDGTGVQVNIMDTGYDLTHEDLAANFLTDRDYDYVSGDFNPTWLGTEFHGTAVAGLVAAVDNSVGGVGVAFGADIVGYRGFGIGASYGDDAFLDAAGLGNGIGNTSGNNTALAGDIITMSGGLGSNVFLTNSNYDDAIAALGTITAAGRDGLGLIFLKSSGNSRAVANSTAREEGTAERYDSTEFSINVAALRTDGWVTDYSTPGANVLTSAFADDVSNFGTIYTTDITGASGYSSGNYTTGFSGTSAAAPQVAGVVALMLDANPDLGWRDVQTILAYSSRHVGSDVGASANTGAPGGGGFEQSTQTSGASWFWNDADDWNGGGLHFSNDYGYGLVDAKAAVRLAETWALQSTSANRSSTFEDDVNPIGGDVIDAGTLTYTINESTNIRIEHVRLDVDFASTYLSDVEFFLTSPGGTRVQLIADTGNSADYNGRWSFGTVAFMGESSAGDWIFDAVDDFSSDPLTIRDADLYTYGSLPSGVGDLWVVTNEFSDYAGVAGHGTSFASTGLIDTFNAAAVDQSDSIVNLAANTGIVDGVAVTFSGAIENIYTGDGNDEITGNSFSEILSAGRGNDMINGGSAAEDILGGDGNDILSGGTGNDKLEGGAGNDTLDGGAGADVLRGGTGIDTLDYSDATGAVTVNMISRTNKGAEAEGDIIKDIENVIGSDFGDIVSADDMANTIWGGDGKDFIRGRGGDDVLYGGLENDILRGEDGADTLDGGDGTDMVLYISSSIGVTIDLGLGTASGGEATGDVLIDIENVRGSFNADTLTGDGIKNRLEGGNGADVISGGGGNDIIVGQAGFDTLTGGADADRFLYDETNWGLDHITDFEDGLDRIDMRGSGLTFGDLAITFNGGDAKIKYDAIGETNTIILDGIDINVTTIDAADFIFT